MLCLESQDLWSVVEDKVQQLENENQLSKTQKTFSKARNKKIERYFFIYFKQLKFQFMIGYLRQKNAQEAWEILTTTYSGQDQVKKVRLESLRARFEKLEIKDSEKVVEYFTRVNSIINQMASNGEILETNKVVEKILQSLPAKFDHVVVAIEESQDTSVMSLKNLQGRLKAHEFRIN